MRWLGLTWDEGPYFQGEYAPRHQADAERLLAEGKAYRCFCTAADLEADRKAAEAAGSAFRYSRKCAALDAATVADRTRRGEASVVRFRMPDAEVAWDDAVHGRISFQGRDLDDLIILRSDGSAIYNMAVVSDDIAMAITHVIRGDDHVSNTPKQIALYRALGAPEPVFAHVPMILGTDGKKLSKRHGATAVGDYQDMGILPVAMRNFLALLGWSPGDDLEILPEDEMIRRFSLEAIQSKPAVFDPAKLEWMNSQYLSRIPAAELMDPVRRQLERLGVTTSRALEPVIDAAKARSRTVLQLAEQVAVRVDRTRIRPDAKADALKAKLGEAWSRNLGLAATALEALSEAEWTAPALEGLLKATAEASGTKLGDVMQPIRVALTGGTVSEPVNELLAIVGRTESLERLQRARGV
jgi:glutamyl-tRNA synthetase